MTTPKVIGRIEKVDFLDFNLLSLDAKIDTGAYSCAIHCHDISEDPVNKTISFRLLDPDHPEYNEKEITYTNYTKTRVKSSNGKAQSRYKIKISVKIGKKKYSAHFTLSDRSDMKYPVLLGRKILEKRFLVDVSSKYLLSA